MMFVFKSCTSIDIVQIEKLSFQGLVAFGEATLKAKDLMDTLKVEVKLF